MANLSGNIRMVWTTLPPKNHQTWRLQVFLGPTPFVVPQLNWDPGSSAGPPSTSRTAHQPGRGGVSSHCSSQGKLQRPQSVACRVQRDWDAGEEAWVATSPGDHLVQPPTRYNCLTWITTMSSREWQVARTMRGKKRTKIRSSKMVSHKMWKRNETLLKI